MKLQLSLALALALAAPAVADVLSLDDSNWDKETTDKIAFIKFFAPWCGHCKAMKEDWEKLAADYEGKDTILIAEVDCTTDDAEELCEDNDVEGFPTLKYGDPAALEDYDGGRDYESLSAFAKENLKPVCSPKNIDLCDDDKKAAILKLQAMSSGDLTAKLEEVEKAIADAEDKREAEIEKLQDAYEKFMEEYDQKVKDIKTENDFGLLKAVIAAKGSTEETDATESPEL